MLRTEKNFSEVSSLLQNSSESRSFRVLVATWNVAGKTPHIGMDLNDFFPADDKSDIYILGFQEIVPLNAGNVLVVEDNEPAVKWLGMMNSALNKPVDVGGDPYPFNPKYSNSASDVTFTQSMVFRDQKTNDNLFFLKRSLKLKEASKTFKVESGRQLKTCKCLSELPRRCPKYSSQPYMTAYGEQCESMMTDLGGENTTINHLRYTHIACKQMVGIFVTVWVKREHVQHISHLRFAKVGCGILGLLGNKGCVSVSMSLHRTNFCFVCSHLTSGEKEGDELKRNSDVMEILRSTQFPRICKTLTGKIPYKILEHDRIIWFGDLNYRIALSYTQTKKLLDHNDWDTLLEKDQLKIEREAGRVLKEWNEGKINFAPTYKYLINSDTYAGENGSSKKKRTPACFFGRCLRRAYQDAT